MIEVRSEVVEYGALPQAPWLTPIESLGHIRAIMLQLLQSATYDEQGRSFATPQAIAAALDTNDMQTKVLVDLLAALVEPADLVQFPPGGGEASGVEVYSLGLYLVAQFYLREAHKADTADSWPSELFSMQQEPSSPMHMTAKAWGKDQSASHRAHLPMMRQHLQEHLALQEALLQGFSGFISKHAHALAGLVINPPHAAAAGAAPTSPGQQLPGQSPASPPQPLQQQPSPGAAPPGAAGEGARVSAAELDRLGFLLRPAQPGGGAAGEREPTPGEPTPSQRLEGGSPMDVCCTPFTESPAVRLSEHSPFFEPGGAGEVVPLEAVAAWIVDSLRQQDTDTSMMTESGGSPHAASPRTSPSAASVFNQLVSSGVTSPLALASDIQGVSKATVVRSEGDFPSNSLRILNCHDAVVYALSPLQYALVSACSDCVVVVGAVGRALRVERCERVQIIAAARCVTINTCHDCIFYLGVNQQPTVLGDNRFLQLAPYNAGYERLGEHMALAGVLPAPNLWDSPITLQPDHRKHHHEPLHESPAVSAAATAATPSPQRTPGSPLQQQAAAAAAAAGAEAQPGPSPMVVSSGAGEPAGGSDTAASTPPGPSTSGTQGVEAEAALVSPVLGTPAAVTLLPPGKLLPFLVPFVGGAGPMGGGPAKVNINIRASTSSSPDSLSGFMGLPEGTAAFPSSPFALPPAYVQAWEAKMKSAAEVRAAVKTAGLDEAKKKELMAAIQAHFKDWLQQTGGMRQVYDLARLERDENSSQMMTGL